MNTEIALQMRRLQKTCDHSLRVFLYFSNLKSYNRSLVRRLCDQTFVTPREGNGMG